MAKQIEDLEKKAAQSTTSVNSMIGIRRAELLKSLGILVGNAVKQPKPLAKNLGAYGKELVKIAKRESELAPERRDRRFMDPTWRYNRLYKAGLQNCWQPAKALRAGSMTVVLATPTKPAPNLCWIFWLIVSPRPIHSWVIRQP